MQKSIKRPNGQVKAFEKGTNSLFFPLSNFFVCLTFKNKATKFFEKMKSRKGKKNYEQKDRQKKKLDLQKNMCHMLSSREIFLILHIFSRFFLHNFF